MPAARHSLAPRWGQPQRLAGQPRGLSTPRALARAAAQAAWGARLIAAAIALALAAAVLHGTWNILAQVSGDPMHTFQRGTLAAVLLSTPAVAVPWLWTGRPGLAPAAAGLCALSGVLEVTYLWLLAAAYRRGELSAGFPIGRRTAAV